METARLKIGDSKAGKQTRIWIEGGKLLRAGFIAKQSLYIKTFEYGELVLYVDRVSEDDIVPAPPERVGYNKVSGKNKDVPVIDICSKEVATFFEGFSHVDVTFEDGILKIRGAV